jgi:hypothetical protein
MLKILGTVLAVSLFVAFPVNAEAALKAKKSSIVSSPVRCQEVCEAVSSFRVCAHPNPRSPELPVMTRELIRLFDSRCAGVR